MRIVRGIMKLKLFIYTFNQCGGWNHGNVDHAQFIEELLRTNQFTNDEIRQYTEKAFKNGQIFERKEGWLAKA